MTRMREKGSVVSFVVVGVLLTVLVVGGLYALKQRNFFGIGQKADEVANQASDNTSSDQANSSDTSSNTSTDSQSNTDSSSSNTNSSDQQASSDTQASTNPQAQDQTNTSDQSQTSTSSDSSSTSSSSTGASTESTQQVATAHSAEELPATGPSDVILTLIGPAVLVGAFVAYRRSYQL